jgi:molybdenum cofactor synthesis domain-containing protein
MQYNLLEKTEIWIAPIKLKAVNLDACARAAARVLALKPADIMVTDVRDETLTLDVLVPTVEAEKIVGCEEELLAALGSVAGIRISPETQVHSQGILGLIALEKAAGREMLKRSAAMSAQIQERISRRCLIFSSGSEILAGQIRDTNTPFLIAALKSENYDAHKGPILQDDKVSIARAFRNSAEDGYGLLITTGGVGAESKDQTLEALNQVDPEARMPYILKFQAGSGRHKKDGVRIGVGRLNHTLIVCLPGPHDELQLAWPVLKEGLKNNWGKAALADALAEILRQKFLSRNSHHLTQKELG